MESQYSGVRDSLFGFTDSLVGGVSGVSGPRMVVSGMPASGPVIAGPSGSRGSRSDLDYLADRIVDGLSGIAAASGMSADLLGGSRRRVRAGF